MHKSIFRFTFISIIVLIIRFFYKQNNDIRTSTYTIHDAQIPASFSNFTIVAVSDLHNKSFGKANFNLLDKIKQLNPDIIVVTGDLINAYHPRKELAFQFIKKASKIVPLYFISGNHETRLASYHDFKTDLIDYGAIVLDNKKIVLKRGHDHINLLGLADPNKYYNKNSTHIFTSQLDYLLTSMQSFNFTILLSHRPEFMPIYAARPINLVISGHAHGGQFRLPFLGGLFAPNQGLFPKFSAGKYVSQQTKMVVSRGLGPSSFPTRLNNKPDLVQVILSPTKK